MDYKKLNRRELIAMIQALSAAAVIPGCKDDSSSDFKDLTNYTSLTVVPPGRKETVIQQYKMTEWVAPGNGQPEVFEQLAAVPDVYLKFLHERAQDPKVNFRIEYGGGASGMCYFNDEGALKITLNGISFATIHEVGHGVETMAYRLRGIQEITQIGEARDTAYRLITGSSEANSIRKYSKTNSKELFADGFSSFYRSPKSRADLKMMPQTFKWLQSILVAPINFGPGESTEGYQGMSSAAVASTSNLPNQATIQPTSPQISTPISTPITPPTSVGGVNLCSASTSELVAVLCQLSAALSGGSGLSLTGGNSLELPVEGQFLTHGWHFVVAKLDISAEEAQDVKVFLDKTQVGTGLKKYQYSEEQNTYSTNIKVPIELTPEDDFKDMKLTLRLDDKLLKNTPVKVSRYSLCGDIRDLVKKV